MLVRSVQFWMARAAPRHFDMKRMAEMSRAGFFYRIGKFVDRMTLDTRINPERFFAVMTGTARFPLCHIRHGEMFVVTGGKEGRVTGTTIG